MINVDVDVDCKRCQELLGRIPMWREGALSDLDKHLLNHAPGKGIKELQLSTNTAINKLAALKEFRLATINIISQKARDANLPDQELNWLLEVIRGGERSPIKKARAIGHPLFVLRNGLN